MFDSPEWLQQLNDRQREAVTARGSPVLVVAGAGSGKTRTLACRVAHLLEEGVPAERILLLTFTRRAAREMVDRAEKLTGTATCGRVWGGTFHAVANRLLRIHGGPLGLSPNFTVLDQSDGADLMDLIRTELDLGRSGRRFPRKDTLSAIYSRTVNGRVKLARALQEWFPWCEREIDGIRSIFERFVQRKSDQGLLDYDDLLLYWRALARGPAGERLARRFDHILVDEYQDTNRLQAEILRAMCRGSTELMAVGDDAQAIYSFRSATVENILDFPGHHPGTRIVKLERNYRSTQPILRAANAVIAQARRGYGKELWSTSETAARPVLVTCRDETEQADDVCRRVLEARERNMLLKEQAVLFRAGHHSATLEVELARRNIPFVKYGGLKLVESAHVKDMLALMRVFENPFDELSWFRVLQLLDGMGPARARRAMEHLGVGERRDESPVRVLLDRPPSVPVASREDLEALRSAVRDCIEGDALPPAAEVERVTRYLARIFARTYPSSANRVRDLEQLQHIAARYESRSRFLSDLTLDPPSSTADLAGPPLLDEDYLILSTIHSAKGGEWDAVYILHAADGMIPSDMALGDEEGLEEELRLFYVALTRARRELHVLFPQRFHYRPSGLDDAHGLAQLTRFISSPVRDLFESQGAAGATSLDAPERGATAVRELLSGLWS